MDIQKILDAGNYHLIDVREPEELITDGAIESAVNIPLGELETRKNEILNLDGDLIFFCRSGNRSGKATDFFKNEGLDRVFNGGSYETLSKLV